MIVPDEPKKQKERLMQSISKRQQSLETSAAIARTDIKKIPSRASREARQSALRLARSLASGDPGEHDQESLTVDLNVLVRYLSNRIRHR
jgi:hypothetical protein